MITILQRVKKAQVRIEGQPLSEINRGILALVGVHQNDTLEDANYLANKIPVLRIFPDETGKMNKSLLDVHGELLLVSQFTLLGNVHQGRRPGFTDAALPDKAIPLLSELKSQIEKQGVIVKEGRFGAMMEVELINDGPVTFILDSRSR
jgi:D-tyrosyl-tRNA(Tyr) deacylase